MYLKKTTKKELLDAYARYCRGGISKKKLGKELGLSEPTIKERLDGVHRGELKDEWFYDEEDED